MCPGHEQLSPVHPPGAQIPVTARSVLSSVELSKLPRAFPTCCWKEFPILSFPLDQEAQRETFASLGSSKEMSWSQFQWRMLLFLENCPGVREWQGNDKSLIFLSPAWWNLGMQWFWAQPAEQFQPNTQPIRINQHMDLRSCHGLAELNWIIHFSQYYHIRAAANPLGAAVCCRLKPWPQSLGYAWLNNVKKLSLQTFNC